MPGLVRAAIFVFFFAGVPSLAVAEDLHGLSLEIGSIERGFWTRPVTNDLKIEGDELVLRRTYRTRVEWIEDGVPGRSVTETLECRLPLDDLVRVRVATEPGEHLLEGGDQDSYCPLTVARFSGAVAAPNCDFNAEFAVCRYRKSELIGLLKSLTKKAKDLMIIVAD